MLIVSPTLLKTAVGEKTQLSLNTLGDYAVGNLNVRIATNLHSSSIADVAIIDSTGADILRVTDDDNIGLVATNMTLSKTSSGGLMLLSNTYGNSVEFKTKLDVTFYGSAILCSSANLMAKN